MAQSKTTITYNQVTGNYLIKYPSSDSTFFYTTIFEPATKIEPFIDACVYFDLDSGLYKYEYTVKNGVNSQQRLLSFLVSFFSPIHNITKPNNQWSALPYSFVPVFSWSNTLISSYGGATPYDGIAPDSSTSGFSFESSGLPTIMKSYSRGATPTLHFIEEPPGEVYLLLKPLRKFPANTVQRKTLGPKDPPEDFVATTFIDTLISYKHQALELGWITNQGVDNSLDKKLENAKKQLEKGKTKTALNHLNAFLNEVEAQKDKHLSSEAYALLKFNAEYLIKRLEEE